MSIKMQDKYKNFFCYIAGLIEQHFPDSETRPDIESVKTIADDETFYKNLQFVYLPLLCNNEKARVKIKRIRELHTNTEDMAHTISDIRTFITDTKKTLDSLDNISDEQFEAILGRISRYAHLFSAMYFSTEQ